MAMTFFHSNVKRKDNFVVAKEKQNKTSPAHIVYAWEIHVFLQEYMLEWTNIEFQLLFVFHPVDVVK